MLLMIFLGTDKFHTEPNIICLHRLLTFSVNLTEDN